MAVIRNESHRKQDIALRLSLAGASSAEIAATLDPETGEPLYNSAGSAGKALKAARERAKTEPEKKAEILSEEIARLNRLQRALWPAATGGDVAAIRESRMLIVARAQLRGVAKGLPEEENPTASDPVDDLAKKREVRRASSQ